MEDVMDKLVSLCKRRGFIFPSSEIYGGLGSFWDFGPLGVEMKRNIKENWWRETVIKRDDVIGIETSIIMHPQVWIASGHAESFYDVLVDCKVCKKRFRQDHLEKNICPECGGEFTSPRNFNLMFETYLGPVQEEKNKVWLRPETAQGMFVDYLSCLNSSRVKIPFGIAQIGKSFRNEVSPGNFIFRSREFEQMEIEYFVSPEEDEKYFKLWIEERYNWYISLGIKKENLRIRAHSPSELAHYAKACCDIEYRFPFGWQELEGVANRSDFDLASHSKFSGKDLSYYDDDKKIRYIPYCIEASAGVERPLLAFLVDAYSEDVVQNEERVVLRLHPKIAPIKVGVFPLVKKDRLPEIAREIEKNLRNYFTTFYDEVGSIGRRYRRQDEIGTPFGITVDFKTLEDNTVTLRYRDTTLQERIKIDEIENIIRKTLL